MGAQMAIDLTDNLLPTDAELTRISQLAERQVRTEQDIQNLEIALDRKSKELTQIRDKELPNALAEIGMSSFTLKSGRKISVKTEVYASIPKDGAQKAFSWLRQHDFGSLIKNIISAEFGKGEDEAALKAAGLLAEAGFRPEQKESVHSSTLKAFLKEQISKGEDVPLELFGAFIVNRSKVE